MPIRPMGDHIVVSMITPPSPPQGGPVEDDVCLGEVIAVGPDCRRVEGEGNTPFRICPADTVIFDGCGGRTVNVGGRSLVVIYESEIIGILTEEN